MGAYGPHHTLFSDWFVVVDNKKETKDQSTAKARIIGDRLVFEGFLHHSGLEFGHRLRHKVNEHIGFCNLVSHEFIPEWDLRPYGSVALKLRTDGRPYLLVLECSAMNTIYQMAGVIHLPPTPDKEWDYYEIPMDHFRPFDRGEFVHGEKWMNTKWLRGIGIMAIGKTGPFHLEVKWIRAFSNEARFDVEDEEMLFIQDLDAMGLSQSELAKFHLIQHQYFYPDFPNPFQFEDDGVFEVQTYLGPARIQRQVFAKMDPDLIKYVDAPDLLPIPSTVAKDMQLIDGLFFFSNILTHFY
ncbi:hypothetical protein RFI_24957 [Reticulomyxa filosa]|uniref:NADH:ubiquinone oxidoreductase intermediate-associated protein 30 domain-containing protein n=1 Tax=Reticulomyxa filosa TaxID=46433 RepID=X6MEX5_RETFI|nr:hypothetical protein RFI_24957 [Reticulomyxa filosa]|eukprot:ETO12419.1 hypothetical protein RFI_24957 [Reticulomyxa filosa]